MSLVNAASSRPSAPRAAKRAKSASTLSRVGGLRHGFSPRRPRKELIHARKEEIEGRAGLLLDGREHAHRAIDREVDQEHRGVELLLAHEARPIRVDLPEAPLAGRPEPLLGDDDDDDREHEGDAARHGERHGTDAEPLARRL